MFYRLLILCSIFALIQNVKCNKLAEINLLIDFIKQDLSESIVVEIFQCWNLIDKFHLLNTLFQNKISAIVYDTNININITYPLIIHTIYFIDLDCENSNHVMSLANQMNLFSAPFKWIIYTKNSDYAANLEQNFLKYNFLVDSNVFITYNASIKYCNLITFYKYDKLSVSFQKGKVIYWQLGKGFNRKRINHDPLERRDLNGTLLKVSVAISNNSSKQHLHDHRFVHIDTVTKMGYIVVNHLIDFVNGSREFKFTKLWGYYNATTKTFSGMVGDLYNDEAELAGAPLILTKERIMGIDFVNFIVPTQVRFVFRQPPLSYVANIFTLPFSASVWGCSVGLCVLLSLLTYFTVTVEWRHTKPPMNVPTMSDSILVTIGGVTQQGAADEPRNGSGRLLMLCAYISLMFLFVSYSANIVALLQSSATNIRTLEDLLYSRLQLGVEDLSYNHYFFKAANDPIQKRVYNEKIAPKGDLSNFLKLEIGVAKIREGFFAFHTELGVIYKIISDTFYESEKCGLQEIEYFKFFDPGMSTKKKSSFKELFRIGYRIMRENGIESREKRLFYTKKPDCLTGGANFVSVGLMDVYAAFLVLGIGVALSIFLFLLEIFYSRFKK